MDTTAVLRAAHSRFPLIPHFEGTHFQCNFGHLNGYSAIYYTYMWSLVIAKDLFRRFRAAGSLLDPAEAERYRDLILGRGSEKPAAELIRDFLGREMQFGPRITDIAGSRLAVLRANRDARDFREEVGHLVDRGRGSGAQVDELSRDRSFPRQFQGRGQIPDVQEVPRLVAVAVDFDPLVRRHGGAEFRDDARIRRCRVLPRAVCVEDPHDDGLEPLQGGDLLARELAD